MSTPDRSDRLSRAWLEAVESTVAGADRALESGRSLRSRVADLEVEPGLIRARIDGSRAGLGTNDHITQLGLRPLADERWDAVMHAIERSGPDRAGVLAGILVGGLRDALLPMAGELSNHCTCADGRDLCRHGAALVLVAAEVFDRDPFALALVRGRGRDRLNRELRRRHRVEFGIGSPADDQDNPRGRDPGTPAAAAYRRRPVAFDRSITAPAAAGGLIPLAAAPPIEAAIDVGELAELVADAARRARAVLAGDGDSGLGLTAGADVARRAVTGDRDRIASATGLDPNELAAAAVAFEHGAAAGLAVSRRRWDPELELLRPGLAALGPGSRVRGNAVSRAGIQLRLDPDGAWWRFEPDDVLGWVLVAPPAVDPADLVEASDLDGDRQSHQHGDDGGHGQDQHGDDLPEDDSRRHRFVAPGDQDEQHHPER